MSNLRQHVAAHFTDFEKSQIWKFMQDFIKVRRKESETLLANPENTRDMDMFYKGQIEECNFFLNLPVEVANYLKNEDFELEEEKGE